jgi:hypothetical protein
MRRLRPASFYVVINAAYLLRSSVTKVPMWRCHLPQRSYHTRLGWRLAFQDAGNPFVPNCVCKGVLRLMRAHRPLCLPKRRFVLTADYCHPLGLSQSDEDSLPEGEDRTWVEDITCIRLRVPIAGCAFLQSRGWASEEIDASLATAAIDGSWQIERSHRAFHHSDRGVQYTLGLLPHDFLISRRRKVNPWEDAGFSAFRASIELL